MDSLMIEFLRHTEYNPIFDKVAVTYCILGSKHNDMERFALLQITLDAIDTAIKIGGRLIQPEEVPKEKSESSHFVVLFKNKKGCIKFLKAIGAGSSY